MNATLARGFHVTLQISGSIRKIPNRGETVGTRAWTIAVTYQRADFALVDGRVTSKALKIENVPLAEARYNFSMRPGTKRLTGIMIAEGKEFLVVAERQRP